MDTAAASYAFTPETFERIERFAQGMLMASRALANYLERPEVKARLQQCLNAMVATIDALQKIERVTLMAFSNLPSDRFPQWGEIQGKTDATEIAQIAAGISMGKRADQNYGFDEKTQSHFRPLATPDAGRQSGSTQESCGGLHCGANASKAPVPKADLLTRAIREIVKEIPNISVYELRQQLFALPQFTFLDSKERKAKFSLSATKICYANSRGNLKVVPASCLKDRLSRAK